MSCSHAHPISMVTVRRFATREAGVIDGWMAEIRVQCADCGHPFEFLGLQIGANSAKPAMSVDGLELRAPIRPRRHELIIPSGGYAATKES
jgi:hypothetical protein